MANSSPPQAGQGQPGASAGRLLEAAGDRREQAVANPVAVGIIDGLEGVQIEHQQADGLGRPGRVEAGVEGVVEGVAIGQPGEAVPGGEPFEFLAVDLVGGDIHAHPAPADHLAAAG